MLPDFVKFNAPAHGTKCLLSFFLLSLSYYLPRVQYSSVNAYICRSAISVHYKENGFIMM